jgi:calcium-dependent protein kinase
MKGGELFDEVSKKGKLTEADTALIIMTVLGCINYCHSENIMHRDIKPENLMLEANSGYESIKLIDFGNAIQFEKGKNLTEVIGTAYYVAPEILEKNYDEKCDLWSIGVLTYILISGKPPFNGTNDKEIFEKVKIGEIDFDKYPIFSKVSKEVKDFITKLLTKDPS